MGCRTKCLTIVIIVLGGIMKKKRKVFKIILTVVIAFVAFIAACLIVFTAAEYRPADEESIEIKTASQTSLETALPTDEELTILSWNIGYCGLSDDADFFMDAGNGVYAKDEATVNNNLENIESIIAKQDADIILIQEIDLDSTRSYHVNQIEDFTENAFTDYASTFAYNFKVLWMPFPIPPYGHIQSGILTLTNVQPTEATRIQLPCPFSWPYRILQLKRCLDVERIPVENSDKELVLINLHLEAYDEGEGKIEQTKMLAEIMQAEYEKGNYVIAGGDYNQSFSGTDTSMYPVESEEYLQCGILDESVFSTNFSFYMDNTLPSCRSLDRAYDKTDENFQYYLIDGFIVSDNVEVKNMETMDYGFQYSDHNPVKMSVRLK